VNNPPAANTVKAGSSVVFKFRLGGDRGLDIFASGSPSSTPCGPSVRVAATANAPLNTLIYDPKADLYSYTWKTDKSWTGTCRRFRMALRDGSEHAADFFFK
jgi:hypothetical protein